MKVLLTLLLIGTSATLSLAQSPAGTDGIGSAPKSGGFLHPGMLHNEQDFERMRAHLTESPWKEGWERLTANPHASLRYKPRPVATVVRGRDRTHLESENYALLFNDAAAAYALALRWQISGDNQYGDK